MRPAASLLAAILGLSCSGQKQAQDPRQILGDDMEYGGVDARNGGASSGAREPEDSSQPANQADCRAASEHLLLLALQAEIDSTSDPAKRRQLEQKRDQAFDNPRVKNLIGEETKECLQRQHTRGEVQCIARIKTDAEIERCVGE